MKTSGTKTTEFLGLVSFALSLMVLISVATYNPADPVPFFKAGASGPVRNFIGPIGAFLAELLIPQMFGVAALVRRSNGSVAEARIGLTNMGSTPLRATAAESAAAGAEASRDALRAAAASADEGTNPPGDLHGAPDYRRHLARVLTGRALAAAAGA